MLCRIFFYILFFVCLACSTSVDKPIKYPDRLPLTEQASEQVLSPLYLSPRQGDKVSPLASGDVADYDGILLDENAAGRVAELRISYDEIYRLNAIHSKYLLSILSIQEQELYRADLIIDQKESELRKIRNSWWHKNKLQVGVFSGIIVGASFVLLSGKVWLEVEASR